MGSTKGLHSCVLAEKLRHVSREEYEPVLTVPDEASLNCIRSFTQDLKHAIVPQKSRNVYTAAVVDMKSAISLGLGASRPEEQCSTISASTRVSQRNLPVSRVAKPGTRQIFIPVRNLVLVGNSAAARKDLRILLRAKTNGCLTERANGEEQSEAQQQSNGIQRAKPELPSPEAQLETDFGSLRRGMHVENGEVVLLFPRLWAAGALDGPDMAVFDVEFLELQPSL